MVGVTCGVSWTSCNFLVNLNCFVTRRPSTGRRPRGRARRGRGRVRGGSRPTQPQAPRLVRGRQPAAAARPLIQIARRLPILDFAVPGAALLRVQFINLALEHGVAREGPPVEPVAEGVAHVALAEVEAVAARVLIDDGGVLGPGLRAAPAIQELRRGAGLPLRGSAAPSARSPRGGI